MYLTGIYVTASKEERAAMLAGVQEMWENITGANAGMPQITDIYANAQQQMAANDDTDTNPTGFPAQTPGTEDNNPDGFQVADNTGGWNTTTTAEPEGVDTSVESYPATSQDPDNGVYAGDSNTPPLDNVMLSENGDLNNLGDLFSNGQTPKASELKDWAEQQGWKPVQNSSGPLKYVDKNGKVRITIKQGSSRTPGSGEPHVEIKDENGQRVDPFGNPVTRRSPGNHTPIDWDL